MMCTCCELFVDGEIVPDCWSGYHCAAGLQLLLQRDSVLSKA